MDWWGYDDKNGPSTWYTHFPLAKEGSRQSPINIIEAKCKVDSTLKPLTSRYGNIMPKEIINNGHGLQVNLDRAYPELSGGPLGSKYTLKQFHWHWGKNSETGSEHTVDGTQYPAELHLVHWNTEFEKFEEAAENDRGLAVLAVFFKVGEENDTLDTILAKARDVPHKGDTQSLAKPFDLNALLPANKNKYWTYKGSLTTPPLTESVDWFVFSEPVQVSEQQLATFRNLKSGNGLDCIVDNFRPPQPLGKQRIVYASPALAKK